MDQINELELENEGLRTSNETACSFVRCRGSRFKLVGCRFR